MLLLFILFFPVILFIFVVKYINYKDKKRIVTKNLNKIITFGSEITYTICKNTKNNH